MELRDGFGQQARAAGVLATAPVETPEGLRRLGDLRPGAALRLASGDWARLRALIPAPAPRLAAALPPPRGIPDPIWIAPHQPIALAPPGAPALVGAREVLVCPAVLGLRLTWAHPPDGPWCEPLLDRAGAIAMGGFGVEGFRPGPGAIAALAPPARAALYAAVPRARHAAFAAAYASNRPELDTRETDALFKFCSTGAGGHGTLRFDVMCEGVPPACPASPRAPGISGRSPC